MCHRLNRLKHQARAELQQLASIQHSDRPWQMPVAAGLATGLPMLVGAWFDHLEYGLISSLGGLVFLYLPATPLYHRMVSLMASAFGLTACYALGVISHLFAPAMIAALTVIAMLVTMVCRFYALGPPGGLFFVLAAAIGAHAPGDVLQIPLKVGLLAMGCLLACAIAFLYSLYMLRVRPAAPVQPLPPPTFDFVVFDSVLIGLFVGLSLALAQALQLQNAYWVPISCLAVIQGASLRAVWVRQAHRVLGTGIGLLVAWAVLSLPLDKWGIGVTMMVLAWLIETLVVRHYGIAVIFITPLTLLLADAASLGSTDPSLLIRARFIDTLLGCAVGLAGGACLHAEGVRQALGPPLRRLLTGRPHA